MTTAAIVVTVAAATASWSDMVNYNAGTVTVWQIMRTQTVGEQDGHCEYTISVSAHNNAGRYFPCGDMQVTRRPAGEHLRRQHQAQLRRRHRRFIRRYLGTGRRHGE